MARTKRPWGVYAGPIIFAAGLAGFWGVQSAMGMRDRVESWGHEFEHSAHPVVMAMPDVPLIPPLFINNERIGRIETVVIQRDRPAAIDSIRIVASVDRGFIPRLEGCAIRLRVASLDPESLKRALRCTRDTSNLMPFGHLEIQGSNFTVPIMVRSTDLPCNQPDFHLEACERGSTDIEHDLDELRMELQRELQNVRVEVRTGVREARDELRRAIRGR
jgi:hypothetical protein